MSDHEWSEDEHGPILYAGACVLEWSSPFLYTEGEIDAEDGIRLEDIEEFCCRTRAWREANRNAAKAE